MKGVTRLFIQAVMVSAMLSITGCVVVPVQSSAGYRSNDEGYGPPSHAPAHGHRYKHRGHDVVYDSSLGVYLVIGYPDYYLYDNYYYKRDRDHWSYSRDLDRGWRDYKDNRLPPGLSKKYASRKDDKGRHKNNNDRNDHDNDRNDHRGSRGQYHRYDRDR